MENICETNLDVFSALVKLFELSKSMLPKSSDELKIHFYLSPEKVFLCVFTNTQERKTYLPNLFKCRIFLKNYNQNNINFHVVLYL